MIELGPEATLGQFVQTMGNLSSAADTAVRWAEAEARDVAVESLRWLAISDPEILMRRARKDLDIGDRIALDDLRTFLGWVNVHLQAIANPGSSDVRTLYNDYMNYALGRAEQGGWTPPSDESVRPWITERMPRTIEEYAPPVYLDLLALEHAARIPGPVGIKQLTYSNPIDLIIIGAIAVVGSKSVLGTLPKVLTIARDWNAAQRLASAKAAKAEYEAELFRIATEHAQNSPLSSSHIYNIINSIVTKSSLGDLGDRVADWREISSPEEDDEP